MREEMATLEIRAKLPVSIYLLGILSHSKTGHILEMISHVTLF